MIYKIVDILTPSSFIPLKDQLKGALVILLNDSYHELTGVGKRKEFYGHLKFLDPGKYYPIINDHFGKPLLPKENRKFDLGVNRFVLEPLDGQEEDHTIVPGEICEITEIHPMDGYHNSPWKDSLIGQRLRTAENIRLSSDRRLENSNGPWYCGDVILLNQQNITPDLPYASPCFLAVKLKKVSDGEKP
jgi:hypothetical protein